MCVDQHAEKMGKLAAIKYVADAFAHEVIEGRKLRLSAANLRRYYTAWQKGYRDPSHFVLCYKKTEPKIERELITEWQRRMVENGKQCARQVYREMEEDWKRGDDIPGLGTWQFWWRRNHKDHPLPDIAPRFPVSYTTLLRNKPNNVIMAMAADGIAAARQLLVKIDRDYSTIRPAELYILDDVKCDVAVIDDVNGTNATVEPTIYFMMDAASRFIPGYVTRGAASILGADVDALIAHVLSTMGIGRNYATHILFERGTVACTEARKKYLEGLFKDRLFIHRTGLASGKTTAGEFQDRAIGKPYSKGVIEAFNRKLHIRLSRLPGQTGNSYQNRPGHLQKRIEHAETLAYLRSNLGVNLESTPLLTMTQFSFVLREAINDYNNSRDHDMTGFHRVVQVETAPGVWKDTNQIISPNEVMQGGTTWGPIAPNK